MTTKKTIAIDASPLLYPGMGVWRVTRALLEALSKLDTPYAFNFFARQLRAHPPLGEFAGKPVQRVRFSRGMAELGRPLGLNELCVPADFYHATNHYLPLKRSSKAVVTIHDLIFLIAPEAHFAETHDFFARKVPAFARSCARIIAISESTRADIVERLKVPIERIDVIPWAVDKKIFSPGVDASALRERLKRAHGIDAPYFFAVSCSEGRKNTPRVLEAFARFAEKNPRHHLVVRWNCPAEIKARFQRGNLAQSIHFCAPVDDEGLADLYRGAAAMIFPSLYEGFGLPILETMSCGTPVITARNSSLPEVAGDAARYVDPVEVDSIVEAFEDFENDTLRVRDLREMGLVQAEKFSWEQTARMTLACYAKAFNL